jgi:hypothetical protein
MPNFTYVMALVLFLLTVEAGAQTVGERAGFSTIRVGALTLQTIDELPMQPSAQDRNIDRSPDRSLTRKILGGIVGATGGFFAGGYTGAWIEGGRCHCDDPGLVGFMVGAPVGAVVGGILGAHFLF